MIALRLKQIQSLWTKEWILKFISLCLASLLWYFVGGEDKVDKNVMIPIEVINLPRDLVISNQYKKEVEVTVNGPRSLILDINKMEITRQVDLSDSKPGSEVVDIAKESIKMPRGISVERVQPSSIILSLDKLIQNDFPINPVTIGEVPAGFKLIKLAIEPASISITGPQSQLSNFEALKTLEINLASIRESTQLQIPLDLEPAIVELIGETSVTADIVIARQMVVKKFVDLPVQVVIDGIEQRVKPAKVTITSKISSHIAEDKKALDMLFAVTAVGNGTDNQLKVEVIPLGEVNSPVEIISIDPPYVTLQQRPTIESETRVVKSYKSDNSTRIIKLDNKKHKAIK